MFENEKYGHLLYNSLTNSFINLDQKSHAELLRIKALPECINFADDPAFFLQLAMTKVLVHEGEEESLLNLLQLKRLRGKFDSKSLNLTIAPTLACNFNCSYCFEKNKTNQYMDDEVEDMLIEFIKRCRPLNYLNINWYGGEPALCFDRITSITEKIKKLNIPFVASIVTNGYLLTKQRVDTLKDLKIRDIQITIDGEEATHDQRRITRSGGKTYQKIVANIDNLMAFWDGLLSIRVNIDQNNRSQYHKVHNFFMKKYASKNIRVYPGFVSSSGDTAKGSCQFNRDEAVTFNIEQYRKHGIKDLQFYPKSCSSGCIATKQNGFIIGPQGEVYSCWHDVGVAEKIVGNIKKDSPWDINTIANYVVGTDPFNNAECRECFYLPVCDGGCPELRYPHNGIKPNNGQDPHSCTLFKDRLSDLLSIYFEIKDETNE